HTRVRKRTLYPLSYGGRGLATHSRGRRAARRADPSDPWATCGVSLRRPAVRPDGERDEHGDDAGEPERALPGVLGERAAEGEGPHLVDNDGDGLVLGERLQPARHGLHRHEGRA